MPSRRRSDDEVESDVEESKERRHKKKSRHRSRSKSKTRSRSRDRDRERRKHRKHKKEKKKHKRRRSSRSRDKDDDEGSTPRAKSNEPREETPEVEAQRLPGLGKYDSDGSEEGEIEGGKEEKVERGEVRGEYHRDEESREEGKRGDRVREEYRRNDDGRAGDRRDEETRRERDEGKPRERDDGKGREKDEAKGRDRSDGKGRDRDEGKGRDREQGRGRDDKRGGEGRPRSEGRERRRRDFERGDGSRGEEKNKKDDVAVEGGGSQVLSLSIDETNKLREKLGLKPLNVDVKENTAADADNDGQDDDGMVGVPIPGSNIGARHLPPEHWGEKAQALKLREKLSQRKMKRSFDSKLSAVKTLGDSDSDDDAENWVKKQKKKAKEKEEAEKKAKMLEELDNEFGVGDIVTESLKKNVVKRYSSRDLAGLRVEHATDELKSGGDTILTLQDGDILDDKYEDVLVNVNIVDTEKTKKSLQNIKDGKAGYQAYDNEIVDDLTGDVQKKTLLYQYDEEIDGQKKDSFTIDQEGKFNEEEDKAKQLAKIRHKLRLESAQSLAMPAPTLASDYLNDQEMMAFKKPKKKRKVRKKMLKADDLVKMANPESLLPTGFGSRAKKRAARIIDDDEVLPDGRLPGEKGSAPMDLDEDVHYDDLPVVEDLTGVKVDDEDDHKTVSSALSKIKEKLKQKKAKLPSLDTVAESVLAQRELDDDDMDVEEDGEGKIIDMMTLNETQEFCRGLGDVGNYEMSGLGESVSSELLDFEKSLQTERGRAAREHALVEETYRREERGTWAEIEGETVEEGSWKEGTKRKHGKKGGGASGGGGAREVRPAILEEETSAGGGMGAALKLARNKGYLDQEEKTIKSTGLVHLKAQNYSIDDKAGQEDDKSSRRGGGRSTYSGGPTSSFSEKKGYKPEVLLEYVDDKGRAMSSKEAFRYLSHKFHGKGSGKLKTEKRHRKIMEDDLMQRMSSTDTPLNTLQRLQDKTKELATPYVVLSGNKQVMGGHTTLKK